MRRWNNHEIIAGGIDMKNMLALMLMIIAAVAVFSCESIFNDQMDSLKSNYFHGTRQFVASDGAASDWFGYRVAVSADGSTVVVGAEEVDSQRGAVYVYRWNGSSWVEIKLTASDPAAGDSFGYSVSVSADGNIVVVGAPGDDSQQGAAYAYRWNGSTWAETRISAEDGVAGDRFGNSVAVSGDSNTIVVGAYFDDDKGSSSGSVYVFRRDGSAYAQTKKLTASDGEANDEFGTCVSVSGNGNTVVVGVPHDDISSNVNQGSVYVYSWDGSSWTETKLVAVEGAADAVFGTSVSVSNDGSAIAAGAPMDYTAGTYAGAVYVYRWNGTSWGETKIIASDGLFADHFGHSVSISGDGSIVMAGANQDDIGSNTNQGSAYIYRWNGTSWAETKLVADIGAMNDLFGWSVAVSADGKALVVSAYAYDVTLSDEGSVWLYAE